MKHVNKFKLVPSAALLLQDILLLTGLPSFGDLFSHGFILILASWLHLSFCALASSQFLRLDFISILTPGLHFDSFALASSQFLCLGFISILVPCFHLSSCALALFWFLHLGFVLILVPWLHLASHVCHSVTKYISLTLHPLCGLLTCKCLLCLTFRC